MISKILGWFGYYKIPEVEFSESSGYINNLNIFLEYNDDYEVTGELKEMLLLGINYNMRFPMHIDATDHIRLILERNIIENKESVHGYMRDIGICVDQYKVDTKIVYDFGVDNHE